MCKNFLSTWDLQNGQILCKILYRIVVLGNKLFYLEAFKVFSTSSSLLLPRYSDLGKGKHTLIEGISLSSSYSVVVDIEVFFSMSLFADIKT